MTWGKELKTIDDMVNCYYNIEGNIKKVEFNSNAVIVHLFPAVDYEGNLYFKKVVTIACVDMKNKELMEALRDEAYRILRSR